MATVTLATPLVIVGVKVAVRTRPVMVKPLSVPPETAISDSAKLEPGSSLKVKLIVAVWPEGSVLVLLVIATVGASVSMVIEGVVPALPVLPAPSV